MALKNRTELTTGRDFGDLLDSMKLRQGFTKITGADGTKQIDEGLVNRRRQELELAQNLWKAPE